MTLNVLYKILNGLCNISMIKMPSDHWLMDKCDVF